MFFCFLGLISFHYLDDMYIKGYITPPNPQNYLLEVRPLVVQASPARWVFQEPICISVPAGEVVRGCIQLKWIFFFWRLSVCLPVSWWVIYECTCAHYTECSAIFDLNGMTPMPLPPYSCDLTLSNFLFVSLDEKIPPRDAFCWCGRGET